MRSLVQVLPRHAATVTAAALTMAGLATTAALTLRARQDLDQALLVAAHAHADPALRDPWAPLSGRLAVQLQTFAPDDLPPDLQPTAVDVLATEEPRWTNRGEERLVLMPIEPHGIPPEQPDHLHPHRIVVARAPRVGVRNAAGSFMLFYTPMAVGISLAAAWAHRRTVARELRPLSQAARRLRQLRSDELAPLGLQAEAEELAVLTGAIDSLLKRLQAAVDGHRRFGEVAAHELRSPLAALQGELEALERRRADAGPALALVRRMATTTEAMLALSRLREDEVRQQRAPTRPSEVVLEAMDRCRAELGAAGCRVRVTLEHDPELPLHPTLCVTAVENLLRNAARHAPGSEVRIATRRASEGVVIEVADDGARGAAGGDGTGLGLRIVEQVARQHGGRFELLRDAPGAVARLVLPAP